MWERGVVDFQSYAGPGDKMVNGNEIGGYQPVSRIGEIVMNAFVDTYEFDLLPPVLKFEDMVGKDGLYGTSADLDKDKGTAVEHRPHFYEWATVREGMICLCRKRRHKVWRSFTAAETAAPVIACAAMRTPEEEKDFYFGGIARTKSIIEIDDGRGPKTDEFFTLFIGGMATVLNNSNEAIHPGDLVEWCFVPDTYSYNVRTKHAPRRVAIQTATASSEKIIGRALAFAKPGEPLDVLLKQ